jgi:hypothetical protein
MIKRDAAWILFPPVPPMNSSSMDKVVCGIAGFRRVAELFDSLSRISG